MPDLVSESAEAERWIEQAKARHIGSVFGKVLGSVVWSDARGPDGEPLVPVDDPEALASTISNNPYILLNGHDPGRPVGQVLEAAAFTTPSGTKFVAAVLGFYYGGDVLSFCNLGFDPSTPFAPPSRLPSLPDGLWIQFGADPKEVVTAWVEQVLSHAPLRVEQNKLSHNASDTAHELIHVGLVYLALVWNPYVTAIASEAGKDTYAAIHRWVRTLLEKLGELRNPILDISSHQDGCQVSFILRGRDIKAHYAAHDALPAAAAQAAQLIANLKGSELPPRQLVYEFDRNAQSWYPSYAILYDNRLITDNGALIAAERLPTGLSLGMSRGIEKPRIPTVRSQ